MSRVAELSKPCFSLCSAIARVGSLDGRLWPSRSRHEPAPRRTDSVGCSGGQSGETESEKTFSGRVGNPPVQNHLGVATRGHSSPAAASVIDARTSFGRLPARAERSPRGLRMGDDLTGPDRQAAESSPQCPKRGESRFPSAARSPTIIGRPLPLRHQAVTEPCPLAGPTAVTAKISGKSTREPNAARRSTCVTSPGRDSVPPPR